MPAQGQTSAGPAAQFRHLLSEEYFHEGLVGNIAILRQYPELLQEPAWEAHRDRLSRPLDLGIELDPHAGPGPVDLARYRASTSTRPPQPRFVFWTFS